MAKGGIKWEADVLCPFYQRESKKTHSISCAGFEPGQTVSVSYRSEGKRIRKLAACCCTWEYKTCPLFCAIEKCQG